MQTWDKLLNSKCALVLHKSILETKYFQFCFKILFLNVCNILLLKRKKNKRNWNLKHVSVQS